MRPAVGTCTSITCSNIQKLSISAHTAHRCVRTSHRIRVHSYSWIALLLINEMRRKNAAFWDLTQCNLVHRYQRFEGISCCSTLKMEAHDSFQKLILTYQTTPRHIPDDRNINIHCHENLKPHIWTQCVSCAVRTKYSNTEKKLDFQTINAASRKLGYGRTLAVCGRRTKADQFHCAQLVRGLQPPCDIVVTRLGKKPSVQRPRTRIPSTCLTSNNVKALCCGKYQTRTVVRNPS
jgi:hypothetical protein